MYIPFLRPDELPVAARELSPKGGDALMIWVAEESAPWLPSALELLSAEGLPFFGGVFPGLIHGRRTVTAGAILQRLPMAAGPYLAELDSTGPAWREMPAELEELGGQDLSAMVFIDCLAPSISTLLTELFHRFGNRLSYFGAGCGTSQLAPEPVVFCNGPPKRDAAVLGLMASGGGVGVRHGWTRRAGPFVATRTSKNVIQELNWQPAMEVYGGELAQAVPEPITAENFFRATGAFPFGIAREGDEDVVRDPIQMTDAGELVCLSDVPEHSVMHVLGSDLESLTAAASTAVRESARGERGPSKSGSARCLVVDCFSRALLMDEDFSRELDTITNTLEEVAPGLGVLGVLGLGEVASNGQRLPVFHNKTIAVGLFDE